MERLLIDFTLIRVVTTLFVSLLLLSYIIGISMSEILVSTIAIQFLGPGYEDS